jgi:hypothetical protein
MTQDEGHAWRSTAGERDDVIEPDIDVDRESTDQFWTTDASPTASTLVRSWILDRLEEESA